MLTDLETNWLAKGGQIHKLSEDSTVARVVLIVTHSPNPNKF